MSAATCWLCGRVLVRDADSGQKVCAIHSTRGAAHLRPAPAAAAPPPARA